MITCPPFEYEDRAAELSTDLVYRYALTRSWREEGDEELPIEKLGACVFIMLNPSTADADVDDPTIRKCVGYARSWRFRRLVVVNLFAFRATSPGDLFLADEPRGPHNAHWIRWALDQAGVVVCAWGIHGRYLHQDLAVVDMLDGAGVRPVALGLTKHGHPKHPLYPPYDARLVPFNPL